MFNLVFTKSKKSEFLYSCAMSFPYSYGEIKDALVNEEWSSKNMNPWHKDKNDETEYHKKLNGVRFMVYNPKHEKLKHVKDFLTDNDTKQQIVDAVHESCDWWCMSKKK